LLNVFAAGDKKFRHCSEGAYIQKKGSDSLSIGYSLERRTKNCTVREKEKVDPCHCLACVSPLASDKHEKRIITACVN